MKAVLVWSEPVAAPDVLDLWRRADADGRAGRSPGPGWRPPGSIPADVGRRAGSYRALEFSRVIPNSDGAGIIDQLGDGVTRLSVGQRVWLFNGQRNGRAFGTRGRIHNAGRASGDNR